jgi:hypothetical protein
VIQKSSAGGREFDPPRAALQKLRADFTFEIAHLPAERGLRRVQPFLGRELDTPLFGDGDEITKMSQLHS